MLTLISILIFIVAILLILIVLVQNSKGGGLSANFTSVGQNMGVRKTADFLEKTTWTLAGILLVLSIAASAAVKNEGPEKTVADKAFEQADPGQVNANQVQSEQPAEEAPAQ
ncbi:MAG: preprotein translocase subunit SecG [Bacteroidetes bacterium GWF2_38_335]|nr:MAG: preprotein translocase subunit SecG [Bacteroidetes bacterium GWF2_38_335]OFY77664.1 MAG: preprotein translocase subunit SecG [Bacteroidetes bacterium RIFOXYA12_FULL_38_20]HBS89107.1 preprotein translocase subunit SecG [Bacteroidales bacterium]